MGGRTLPPPQRRKPMSQKEHLKIGSTLRSRLPNAINFLEITDLLRILASETIPGKGTTVNCKKQPQTEKEKSSRLICKMRIVCLFVLKIKSFFH